MSILLLYLSLVNVTSLLMINRDYYTPCVKNFHINSIMV